jgi:hypothetical protein
MSSARAECEDPFRPFSGNGGSDLTRAVKNRDYWRYEMERESAINKRRQRASV